MAHPMQNVILISFKITCFILAAYMTILQVLRYVSNDDISTFAYKQFNKSPRDKYPTFTLCFQSNVGDIFNHSYLNGTIGENDKNGRIYMDVLYGKDVDDVFFRTLLLEDFEKATINIETLMTGFNQLTSPPTGTKLSALDKNQNKFLNTMYVSYQDPDKCCFTRKNKFQNSMYKVTEDMTINLAGWETKDDLNLYVYIHYPGQFTRALESNKDVLRYSIRSLGELIKQKKNEILISLSLTNVLRRRPDAKISCNPTLHDDESKLRLTIIDQVGCTPPYWKHLNTNYTSAPFCNLSSQLLELKNARDNLTHVMTLYEPPCDQMNVVTDVTIKSYGNAYNKANPIFNAYFNKNKKLHLKFKYMDRHYQEVTNNRDFGFDSFWSSVGGFIGIFLGYSMLQIPEMLMKWIFRNNKIQKKAKKKIASHAYGLGVV